MNSISKVIISILLTLFTLISSIQLVSSATAIETIKVGDKVLAANPETGDQAVKTVVQAFVNETNELVHVTVNGETITTTPEHPFYVPQKGWTGAIHLRAGDILVSSNGEYVVVEKVEHELLESPVKVYNFEVEDFHTYYVSELGVLVHNRGCDDNYLNYERNGKQYGKAPRSNQAQNKQFSSIVKKYRLTKEEARILHESITKQGYSREEIIDELLTLFPNKKG